MRTYRRTEPPEERLPNFAAFAATFAAAMDRFLGDRQALAEAGEAAGRYIHSNAGAADAIYAEIGL